VSGLPSWNFTPWRILKVHTSAVELEDQLVASTGRRVSVWSESVRYSPVWPSMSRPPWSEMVTGLIAAAGVVIPTLIVAPEAPAADDDEGDGLDEPQAARIPPSTGAEIPTSAPRRRSSRRLSLPATN
jgi:hypothetical protein